jgi:hypothetical protein
VLLWTYFWKLIRKILSIVTDIRSGKLPPKNQKFSNRIKKSFLKGLASEKSLYFKKDEEI